MKRRMWAVLAVAALSTLAGCGSGGDSPTGGGQTPTPGGSGVLGGAPTAPATTPPTTTKPPVKPVAKPLTCTQLKNAKLGSATVRFNGYPDYIPLADGIWNGEDGASVQLQQCAIGDLTNDAAADGIASIVLSTGGTGSFYSLAVWRNVSGAPDFTALLDLGDRTPVESIAVSGNRATVVYLTRADDEPPVALTIRRTAVFKVSGGTLVEQSHTDAAYTP
ncbi:MAG TPA: hypothetical protein VF163_14935 [Micromonosporaceae bacterium]